MTLIALALLFALLFAFLLAVGIRLVRSRLAVVEVAGPSMRPALASGDRVLVRRAPLAELRSGLVVVVEQPDVDGRWELAPPRWPPRGRRAWLIKRVAAVPGERRPAGVPPPGADPDNALVPPGMFVVLGDNAALSLDSRVIGCIPADRLLGIMVRPVA